MKKYAHFRNNIRILVAVEPPSQQNNNPSDETTKKNHPLDVRMLSRFRNAHWKKNGIGSRH
jgi:hypothetical protein